MSIAKAVCLIACHKETANDFAVFAENLIEKEYRVQVYASGSALKRFRSYEMDAIEFDADNLSTAFELANRCSLIAAVVLTDMDHTFDIQFQEALKIQAPHILRLAYYDSREPYVSATAVKVMNTADRVLFANYRLAFNLLYKTPNQRISLPLDHRIGLGYYPTDEAMQLIEWRKKYQIRMRRQLFKEHSIEDTGQKVIVYFGGNNEDYFEKAFPTFLSFLKETDLSHFIFLIQQHPKTKKQKREELHLQNCPEGIPIILSNWEIDDAQIVADAAIYSQASMGPFLALANIPTIQVGHEIHTDILIRNKLCLTATTASEFIAALLTLENKNHICNTAKIIRELGINNHWFEILQSSLVI
jgi:hypothetical protein